MRSCADGPSGTSARPTSGYLLAGSFAVGSNREIQFHPDTGGVGDKQLHEPFLQCLALAIWHIGAIQTGFHGLEVGAGQGEVVDGGGALHRRCAVPGQHQVYQRRTASIQPMATQTAPLPRTVLEAQRFAIKSPYLLHQRLGDGDVDVVDRLHRHQSSLLILFIAVASLRYCFANPRATSFSLSSQKRCRNASSSTRGLTGRGSRLW